jgi:hypothetical protein
MTSSGHHYQMEDILLAKKKMKTKPQDKEKL